MAYGLLVLDTHPEPSKWGQVFYAVNTRLEAARIRELTRDPRDYEIVEVTD